MKFKLFKQWCIRANTYPFVEDKCLLFKNFASSLMSYWQPDTNHGRNIQTTETGIHNKSGHFPSLPPQELIIKYLPVYHCTSFLIRNPPLAIMQISLVERSLGTMCKMIKQKMIEERIKQSRFTKRSREIMTENPPLKRNPPFRMVFLVQLPVPMRPGYILFSLFGFKLHLSLPSNHLPFTQISLSELLFFATQRALTHNINETKKNQGFFIKLALQSQTRSLSTRILQIN